MDILNFISWIKGKRQVTSVDPAKTLIPIGLKDGRRDDEYLAGAISVADFAAQVGGNLSLTTTGSGGTSSLSSNTLNIPVYQTEISHIEWNDTDKTIWNNGKGNISTNTSYGDKALISNTTGNNNTALGNEVLMSNDVGQRNVAIGSYALKTNSNGEENVAIGYKTLELSNSDYNVGIGSNSLKVSTGSGNTSIGAYSSEKNTTGSNNTSIGLESFVRNTTGSRNVAVGRRTLEFNVTGNDNTAVGEYADSDNFSGCVILGRNAKATGNNQFVVGSSTTNAGAVILEVFNGANYSSYWAVNINGINYKIPLAFA